MTALATLLAQGADRDSTLRDALALILQDFHAQTGTIHVLDVATQQLHLAAQIGLPPAMVDVVRLIPFGKGIAGQTVAHGKPVSLCNLQSDSSGVARPGAKQTGLGGVISVPMRSAGQITGTLGIGTVREHEFTAEETTRLEQAGEALAEYLVQK